DPRRTASRGAELDDVLASFRENLVRQPFGDGQNLVPAARKVVGWTESAIKELESTAFDAARARLFLDRLCKMAVDVPPDYDSARQIAWAFRVIYRESTPENRRDPAIDPELDGLEAELALDLPPARTRAPIETALADRLRKAADFDPAPFRA